MVSTTVTERRELESDRRDSSSSSRPAAGVAQAVSARVDRARPRLLAGLAGVAVAALLAACGGSSGGGERGLAAPGRATDREFIAAMIPHHQGAIAMARVATRRAEHPEIRRLAQSIISAQEREIRELRLVHRDLFGGEPGSARPQLLGLSMSEAGMAHDTAMLETARPFDRAFIDMMIPHHEGAVRMAKVVLKRGSDPRLKRLARDIVRTQTAEIRSMKRWRQQWYGSSATMHEGAPQPKSSPMGGAGAHGGAH